MEAWSNAGTDGKMTLMRLMTLKKYTVLSQKVQMLTFQCRKEIFFAYTSQVHFLMHYKEKEKALDTPHSWQTNDKFTLVSFVCQLFMPQVLNLYFKNMVQILALKVGGKRGDGIPVNVSFNKGSTIRRFSGETLNGIYCFRFQSFHTSAACQRQIPHS